MKKLFITASMMLSLSGCAPEVGSPAWCKAMDKKDKVKEWTIADATEYAKHCVFTQETKGGE